MNTVELEINEDGEGKFYIEENKEQIGQMVFAVTDNLLTVFHTDVDEKAEGKGYAKRMLEAMVEYARKNKFLVKPLCPYVHLQFKRHPQDYADIWYQPE